MLIVFYYRRYLAALLIRPRYKRAAPFLHFVEVENQLRDNRMRLFRSRNFAIGAKSVMSWYN